MALHRRSFAPRHHEAHDAAQGLDTILAEDFDWQNHGGITRAVRLVELPATFIRDYHVGLGRAGRIVSFAALCGSASAGAEVRFSLPEPGQDWRATADAQGRMAGTIPLPRKAARWSPEAPGLYAVTPAAGADSVTDPIGFRAIERRGNRLLLNGQPLTLPGVSIHEEAMGTRPARVLDEAAARALLSEAKALGSNFVRLAHDPHTESMVRLADEMGLLVWSEIPVYRDIAFDSEATYVEASAMLRAMIARDMNRPSVVIWSVANEAPINRGRLTHSRSIPVACSTEPEAAWPGANNWTDQK